MEKGEFVSRMHHHRNDALAKNTRRERLSTGFVTMSKLVLVSQDHVVIGVDHPAWKELLPVKNHSNTCDWIYSPQARCPRALAWAC